MDVLDAQISEREMRAQELRDELARIEQDLQALYRARDIVRGQTDSVAAARRASKGQESIPNMVEQILREHGPAHVDDLVDRLALKGYRTNKQSVSSAITRWIAKEQRFKRVGKNKFALRDVE